MAKPTRTAVLKVLVIVVGVMIASVGEIRIHWLGFWLQIAGLVFEAMRLVMIQVLLSNEDDKMDPLVSLYYYAPVCGVMNLVMVWFTELNTFRVDDFVRVGPSILVFNAMVAFCLNVAGVFLVRSFFSLSLSFSFSFFLPQANQDQPQLFC